MSRKWIVVRKNKVIVSALWEDFKIQQIHLCEDSDDCAIGDIFVGKVKNLISDIHACFIEYLPGRCGYLDLRNVRENVSIGDEFPVQIQREAIKSKEPVLSKNLQLSGRYVVVMSDRVGYAVSTKITNRDYRDQVKADLENYAAQHADEFEAYSAIVRTNAPEASTEEMLEEYRALCLQMKNLLSVGNNRSSRTLLYKADTAYCLLIRDTYGKDEENEILTDDESIWNNLRNSFAGWNPEKTGQIRLCLPQKGDYLSLAKKFELDKELERCLQKNVWLSSGAYLVIEPTEAMVVIDVNSGKNISRKGRDDSEEDLFLKINLEAAVEVARQLRLRNLSGMIMVDFIDMKSEENKSRLIQTIKAELKKDPVKANFVDMTKLGIVEITRKRSFKPLHEVLHLKDIQ